MADEIANQLRASWATIDRLRDFIRSLEWSGLDVVDYDGVTAACCPSCGGFKPGEYTCSSGQHGHYDDCKLIAALGPSAG